MSTDSEFLGAALGSQRQLPGHCGIEQLTRRVAGRSGAAVHQQGLHQNPHDLLVRWHL